MFSRKSSGNSRKNKKRRTNPKDIQGTSVKALFADYDGTLSSINVARSESAVPKKTMTAIQKISQHIPVAIITTKDLTFVVKRTPFAQAWAALGGLEIRVNGATTKVPCLENSFPQVTDALKYTKNLAGNVLTIEEKHDSEGTLVAFSVDWRQAKSKALAIEKAAQIAAYCETLSLNITMYKGQPFFDVFPCPIDKGLALLSLKKKFGLQDGIMYLGDSTADNAAFKEADISVGVLHLETPVDLCCDYFVKAEELNVFLESILEGELCFDAGWASVMGRKEATRYLQDQK